MEQTDKNYESNTFEQLNKLDLTNIYRTCTQTHTHTDTHTHTHSEKLLTLSYKFGKYLVLILNSQPIFCTCLCIWVLLEKHTSCWLLSVEMCDCQPQSSWALLLLRNKLHFSTHFSSHSAKKLFHSSSFSHKYPELPHHHHSQLIISLSISQGKLS